MRKICGSRKLLGQRAIQPPRRFQVASQRLFHHDVAALRILRQPGLAKAAGDDAEQRRRRGKIEDAIGLGVPLRVELSQVVAQLSICRRIVEIGLLIRHRRHEAVPVRIGGRPTAAEAVHAVAEPIAQRLSTGFDAVHRTQGKRLRQVLVQMKAEQGGDQLSPRQIPSAAENHQNGRPMTAHRFPSPLPQIVLQAPAHCCASRPVRCRAG